MKIYCHSHSHFAKLATSIAVKDASACDEEDDSLDLKNFFPGFLWLLRDAILTVPSGPNGEPMSSTDYLIKSVLKRGKSFKESTSDIVGRAILTVFPTIECMTLPPPSADPSVMQDIVAKQDLLTPQFNKQLNELVGYVLQHVQPKKGLAQGKVVDGPILVTMTTQYLEAVNNPDAVPCITDTWCAAVEIRCKNVLHKMVQEYAREIETKVAEVGFPMEEDSPIDTSLMKPCTLLGIHRMILLEKCKSLLRQVGHFIGGSVPNTGPGEGELTPITRESLSAELEQHTAIFAKEDAEIEGQLVTKKTVAGGILFKFAQRNYAESHSHCLALFAELYKNIEQKMEKRDNSYTYENLERDLMAQQKEYYQRAVGPAKWEVYTEKESFLRSQEGTFKQLSGFKKEAFEALQKAAEEKARYDHLHDSLNQLQAQIKNDGELYEKKMEAMQKEHQKEIQKLYEEQAKRMENDGKKYEDFMKAQMSDMAGIMKENREEMRQHYDKMFEAMKTMSEQNQKSVIAMNESVAAMTAAIKNTRKSV